jgi:hypothetical protein
MEVTRRKFLHLCMSFSIGSLVSGIITYPNRSMAASSENKHESDPCNNTAKLSEGAKLTRKTLKYVSHSSNKDKVCHNCLFWIKPKTQNDFCGKCEIIPGLINPEGYCESWKSS